MTVWRHNASPLHRMRIALTVAALLAGASASPAHAVDRELHIVATVEADQTWTKNDPEYPGNQWSKGHTSQRYEITTRLRSDGRLEVRNLLDPDLNTRLEAKTIYYARQAKRRLEAAGKPFVLPKTEDEKLALSNKLREEKLACKGDPQCSFQLDMDYAAIFAAIEYPEALEEDTVPGQYLYFMPYDGCPGTSRVQMTMSIEGVRYNKDVDDFIPFTEQHAADARDTSDGMQLCTHFTAVIDTQDPDRPMWQETIHVPSPKGTTLYTENGHTSRTQQSQPIITVAVEWINEILRHAKTSGSASAVLDMPLSMNGNSTWLGLWTGKAKVSMTWSFNEVKPAADATQPHAETAPPEQ